MTLKEMRETAGGDVWRQQCMRNLMDCYALGMEVLSGPRGEGGQGREAMEALTRLMVEGMRAETGPRDEDGFYRKAAGLCRESAEAAGEKAGLFRVYAAIFEDLGGKEG